MSLTPTIINGKKRIFKNLLGLAVKIYLFQCVLIIISCNNIYFQCSAHILNFLLPLSQLKK